MKMIQKILTSFIFTLMLTSCCFQLQHDLKQAQQELQNANRQLESLQHENINYARELNEYKNMINRYGEEYIVKNIFKTKSAAVASACEFILNLCPRSLTKSGLKALKDGFMPDKRLFWILLFLKFVLMTVFVLSIFTYGWWLFKKSFLFKKIVKMQNKVEQLQAEVETNKHLLDEVDQVKEKIAKLNETHGNLKHKCNSIEMEIFKRRKQSQQLKEVLADIEKNIVDKRRKNDEISNFF